MSKVTFTACTRRAAGPVGLLLALAAMSVTTAAAAGAETPMLRVTNLGQSSAPVEVGQPPFELAAKGGCAHPFTFANESACPPGTWPPLYTQWGPIEDVAGGDTLHFEFSSPVSSVSVGSTSNYEPGLHDPDGHAISNYDVVAESSATPTADPAVWETTLPPLDVRAISWMGYTFSVVAADESGFHDYPFEIRSPRFGDELTKCGIAYYSTGFSQGLCFDKAVKVLPPRHGLALSGAAYDGRVLTLTVEVPGSGTLRLAVPTRCGRQNGPTCHRRTRLVRSADQSGPMVIRKPLSLRLTADQRITIPVRFEEPEGGLSVSTLTVKVRSVRARSRR